MNVAILILSICAVTSATGGLALCVVAWINSSKINALQTRVDDLERKSGN